MVRVIDSHVHLFDEDGLKRLAWMTPTNKLNHACTLQDHLKEANAEGCDLRGIVFIETDVRSGISESDWYEAIEEYKFAATCEGTTSHPFIKAIIPWAPVPGGRASLEKYSSRLQISYPAGMSRIKGFRYLVQDKPQKTMTQPDFVDGLNWLSENGLVFDVGIDMNSGGIWQLKEFSEMESQVSGLKFVINHLTKPNMMQTDVTPLLDSCRELWTHISRTTKNEYYFKISGGFSEMPSDVVNGKISEIVKRLKPWVSLFIDIFGKEKLIWGSDWPVCTLNMSKGGHAWSKWYAVTDSLALDLGLSQSIFYDNVMRAYNI